MAKEIPIIIKVDGKQVDLAKTSINDFNKIYSDAQKKLQSLPLGSDEWKKLNAEIKNADKTFEQTKEIMGETESKFKSLKVQIRQATVAFQEAEEKGDVKSMKKLKKDLDDLNDQLELTTLKSMKFTDALATMPGIAGFVGKSIQGIDKAFKVLVANPILAIITAIVGAFTFLKEALSKTSEGQAALTKVTDALNAVMAPLLALLNNVAVPLFEKLAGLITKVGDAFSWFAQKLGISSEKIKQAKTDLKGLTEEAKKAQDDINGYISKGNDTKKSERQKELDDAKKEYDDKIALAKQFGLSEKEITNAYNQQRAAINKKYNDEDKKNRDQKKEETKKNALDEIAGNENLVQSQEELKRAKEDAILTPLEALKKEQSEKDADYQREKKRIEDSLKVANLTEKEKRDLQIELNDLEKDYLNDKKNRTKEINKEEQNVVDKKKEANQFLIDLQIKAIQDEATKAKTEREKQYKDEEDRLKKLLADKLISQDEYNTAIKNAQTALNNDLTKIDDDKAKQDAEKQLKKLDDELKFLQIKQGAMKQGTSAYFDVLREIQKKAEAREIADLKASDEFKKLNKQEQEDAITNIQKKGAKDRKDIAMQEINQYMQFAGQILGAVSNIFGGINDINQKQQELDLKAAEGNAEEQEKIKKKYFEKNKKNQIAQTWIQTLQSAMQAFSSLASIPVVGPALGIAAAAAAIIMGKKKVDQIKATQYESTSTNGGDSAAAAPTANLGKNYEKGGLINGRRHAEGGTLIEAEKGEAIMTRGAVTMFGPLLSQMNQMGGGTSFVKSAVSTSYDNPKSDNPAAESAPIIVKSYVVSNEMTSSQEKQARLKDLSTL